MTGSIPRQSASDAKGRRSSGDFKLASGAIGPAPRSDCKVLGSISGVQLIVFFAPIREILKRKIYGGHKQRFFALKVKVSLAAAQVTKCGSTNLTNSNFASCPLENEGTSGD